MVQKAADAYASLLLDITDKVEGVLVAASYLLLSQIGFELRTVFVVGMGPSNLTSR